MRLAPVLLFLVFLLPLMPPAAAHGAHHVTPFSALLPPRASQDVVLDYEGGPLHAGWMLIVVTRTTSNGTSPTVQLLAPVGGPGVSWTLPANGPFRYTTAVPETGVYSLRLTNPSAGDIVRIDLFFDQSCSCTGKILLAQFDLATVVFNYDLTAGQRVQVLLNEPKAAETRVTLATRTGGGASWPADFDVIKVSEVATPVTVGSGTVGVHEFVFTAAEAQTYYFVVEAKRYIPANYTSEVDLGVAPEIHYLPADGQQEGTPLLLPILAVVVVGVGALVWALLRRRDKPLKEDPLPRRRRRR